MYRFSTFIYIYINGLVHFVEEKKKEAVEDERIGRRRRRRRRKRNKRVAFIWPGLLVDLELPLLHLQSLEMMSAQAIQCQTS